MSRARLPDGYDFTSPSSDFVGYWRLYMPKAGTFCIRRVGGQWHAMLDGESLGSYGNPTKAHRALISGLTERPSGVDPAKLKRLPELAQWPFYTGIARLSQPEVSKAPLPESTWQFVLDDTYTPAMWTWRRMRVDGTIEQISHPSPKYAQAVVDAIRNAGFRPKRDSYVVSARGTYTHFRPGEPPITIPPDTEPTIRAATDSLQATGDDGGSDLAEPPGKRSAGK